MEIGDKVRVINVDQQGFACGDMLRHTVGEIGILMDDAKDYQPFYVAFDNGEAYWYYRGEIEPVEE